MKKLRTALSVLRVHLLTHSGTVFLGSAVIVVSLLAPGLRLWHRIARMWARHVLRVSGIQMTVQNQERVDLDKPFIVMSNHVSNMDIPVLFLAFPVEFTFLTKHTLKKVPFFGWALQAAGFIFVDRSNPDKARESIDAAAHDVSSGRSIVVFPEGTRSPDGSLLPFKKGGFVLAAKTGVQVVPVYLKGAYEAMPKNTFETRSSVIDVLIGEPIDATDYTLETKEELMRDVRLSIEELARGAAAG